MIWWTKPKSDCRKTASWMSSASTIARSALRRSRLAWQFGVIPTKPDYEITTAGGQVNIVDISGNGETLTLSAPAAGQLLFAVPGRKFRVDGGPLLRDDDSGPLDLSAITQISVSSEKGDDQINIGTFTALPSLTVSGGEGDDLVTFTNNISFAADASLDVDLRSDKDRCVIAGQLQLTGTGAATVRTNRDLVHEFWQPASVSPRVTSAWRPISKPWPPPRTSPHWISTVH